MHASSQARMADLVRLYLAGRRSLPTRVLDVGSLDVNGSYRSLFADPAWTYVGLDVVPGPGVDVVVADEYDWTELAAASFDVVVSGQALEHIAYPWKTMEEVARVLRPGGLAFIVVPGAGPEHRHPIDCWRFLPDGLRALATWAGLTVMELHAHADATGYDDGSDQWRDTVMVAARGPGPFGDEFERRRATWSDVVDHLPRLYTEGSRRSGSQVIELGVRTGNSTVAFLAAAEAVDGHVWSVDRQPPAVPGWWSTSSRWTCIVGDDIEVAPQLPNEVDVVFLDTSHSYEATRRELLAYVPKVRAGGVVLCHDTEVEQPEGLKGEPAFPVRQAIDEVAGALHLPCEYVAGCFGLGVISIREEQAAMGRTSVTIAMVTFDNEDAALVRLARDVMPTLDHYRELFTIDLLVLDNSASPSSALEAAMAAIRSVPARYVWNGGRNVFYGPALNQAAAASTSAFLVYVCASHGSMRDPTWLGDLLRPFAADGEGRVAQTGSVAPSGSPAELGFPDTLPWRHIQGGVFAARRAVLAAHPYPTGERAHYLADVHQSLQLMAAGYEIVDVPTVKSVWRCAAEPGPWKYVHDAS